MSTIASDYDAEADVLYLSRGRPEPAFCEIDDDGLILRYSIAGNVRCGVTVMSYRRGWIEQRDYLANSIAEFLGLPHRDVLGALPQDVPQP